jgi:MFS family permease
LTLVHLIIAAAANSACGALFTSAHTVAIRHVVPAGHLPTALAQDEARGYIAKLTGQPIGGYLYAISPALPVGVDAVSFLFGAALTAIVRLARGDESAKPGARARQPRVDGKRHASMRTDMWTGHAYVWNSAFLRTTLLCSIGINSVFAGLTLAIVAAATQHGTHARALGIAFGIGAAGGILGAAASHRILNRLRPATLIYGFGWTVTAALLVLGTIHLSYAIGGILAAVYFVTTPANAMLFAAQIHLTPSEMQGRVVSAALLTIGVATPLGPLLSGYLIEHTGQTLTFAILAAVVAACTITMQMSTAIRATPHPGN